MLLFKKAEELSAWLIKSTGPGKPCCFVPTMGALHTGHISLINSAREKKGICVCSIFVNPTQFNDPKDFEKYPHTIESDIDQLELAGCDVLFLPSVQEIYPNGLQQLQHYELGYIETLLEGKFRPGHFQGVCQVVDRLLSIVQPHFLFLGQKDYQQCMIIKKMVELTGKKTELIICPTLREADGLAMSSRNMRLSETERKEAVKISETLSFIRQEIRNGYVDDLRQRASDYLNAEGFRVDYVAIADADTLEPVEIWDGQKPLVALVAAFLHEVRLIDNMLINPAGSS